MPRQRNQSGMIGTKVSKLDERKCGKLACINITLQENDYKARGNVFVLCVGCVVMYVQMNASPSIYRGGWKALESLEGSRKPYPRN